MLNISSRNVSTQDLVNFADAIDRMSQNHVPGVDNPARAYELERLVRNLLFINLTESPKTVDELVTLTEEHYVAVNRDVSAYVEEQREHVLTAHEYGLSQRAA